MSPNGSYFWIHCRIQCTGPPCQSEDMRISVATGGLMTRGPECSERQWTTCQHSGVCGTFSEQTRKRSQWIRNFLPDVTLGIPSKEFNLGFIRPENLVSHGQNLLGAFLANSKWAVMCLLLRSGFRLATLP
jgi:hypothetical protein